MNKNQNEGHFALCLKEFKFCAFVTMAYILISCLLCQIFGYGLEGKEVTFIYGIPLWAVIGVVAPWVITVIVTVIYALGFMKGEEE